MTTSALVRWSGAALAVGGILNAVLHFVIAGQLTGAAAPVTAEWGLAQGAHFWSGLLLLCGLLGLYVRQADETGWFGAIAFLAALWGTALYIASGVLLAFIWPVIAANAPALVELSSPFYTSPPPVMIASWLLFVAGWFLMGVVTARARILPRAGAVALAAGALLEGLPPRPFGPVPWAFIDAASALFALGTVWIGLTIWHRTQEMAIERG